MASFTKEQIAALDKVYRINLINSLSGYKSANLIGTVSPGGKENVAVFSSVTHLGSHPALLGFILRPNKVPRNTYKNIKETGCYTINHIIDDIIEDAHHTSARYPMNVSEFDVTNLKSKYKDGFIAPFVEVSPIKIAMKYLEEYFIKANETILLLGEIQSVYIENDLLDKDGFVNLSKGKVAAINGLDGYAIPDLHERFGYQRPKDNLSAIG